MTDQVLAEVTRGGVVESVHYGSGALVDARGTVLRAWGDPDRLVFPRSAMKPVQSLVVCEAGTVLTTEQWALSGASHDGEEMHQTRVRQWLDDLGHSEQDLACGPAWPAHGKTRKAMVEAGQGAGRVVHNCSGKHCGQLSYCAHMHWDAEGYEHADHPAQKQMIERFSELADEAPRVVGVDGCSMPAPQLSLHGFGRAMAQIASSAAQSGTAAETVISAAIAYPELTGGSTQWNGVLTKASGGKLYAKTGAEGVFSVIAPSAGLGLVVKIADGATRASEVAIAGLIAMLAEELKVDPAAYERLSSVAQKNADGIEIGTCRFAGGAGLA